MKKHMGLRTRIILAVTMASMMAAAAPPPAPSDGHRMSDAGADADTTVQDAGVSDATPVSIPCPPTTEDPIELQRLVRKAQTELYHVSEDVRGLTQGHDLESEEVEALIKRAEALGDKSEAAARAEKHMACLDPSYKYELVERMYQALMNIQAEVHCRREVSCLAGRLMQRVCAAQASLDEVKGYIRAEKANPTGIVNLRTLHDLGRAQQAGEQELRGLTVEYRRLTKKAPNLRGCVAK